MKCAAPATARRGKQGWQILQPPCRRCRSWFFWHGRPAAQPAAANRPEPSQWEKQRAPGVPHRLHVGAQMQPGHRQPPALQCLQRCRHAGQPQPRQAPPPVAARWAGRQQRGGCGAAAAPVPAGWGRLCCAPGCCHEASLLAGRQAESGQRPAQLLARVGALLPLQQPRHCRPCQGCWCGPGAAQQACS